ncbi:MAG: mannose-1-phosphate guanylyltransferase [Bacteroidales bacterium]
MANYYCIIMAGGVGSRFWPISRNSRPKQFLDILGVGRTFLQQTYDRFRSIIPSENFMVVTAVAYKDLVKEQLPDLLDENILAEPYRRNTAPCIAYATYKLHKKDPNATVIVAPSDHVITNENLFIDTIKNALDYASKSDKLFALGINPIRPETGYGYIQINTNKVEQLNNNTFYDVKTFTEKPNVEIAQTFLDSGEFLWNSGIFIWNLKTIIKELETYLPEVSEVFKVETYYYTDREDEYIGQIYQDCESISIDYGIMEKTDKAWVIKAMFGWSDLGTWNSFYQYCEDDTDENDNLTNVKYHLLNNVSDSIVLGTNPDKLYAVAGLKDYLLVDTNDALVVCSRKGDDFKNLITDLNLKKSKFQ